MIDSSCRRYFCERTFEDAKTGEAYNAFDPTAATNVVVFPLIMDRNSGYFTGFSVMNVGTAATTVSCMFTDVVSVPTFTTLAPDSALVDIQNGKIANKYVGSAVCRAGSGGKIIGVVNELLLGGTGDQFLVYEGINN